MYLWLQPSSIKIMLYYCCHQQGQDKDHSQSPVLSHLPDTWGKGPRCRHVYNWTWCGVLGNIQMCTVHLGSPESNILELNFWFYIRSCSWIPIDNLIFGNWYFFFRHWNWIQKWNCFTWDTRTEVSDLVIVTRRVFSTPGLVSPRSILLTHRHVITATCTHHQTHVTGVGLGAVTRYTGTRD